MFTRFLEEKEMKMKQKKDYKQLNSSNGSINLDEIMPKPASNTNSNLKKINIALKEGSMHNFIFFDYH